MRELCLRYARIIANQYCNGSAEQTFDNYVSIKGSDLISNVARCLLKTSFKFFRLGAHPETFIPRLAVNTLNGDELGNDPCT